VDAFATMLHPIAPVVTVRWSMGPDIAAACGQLRVELEKTRGEAQRERKALRDAATGGAGERPLPIPGSS
jgi:hypothetical protein